MTPNSRSVNYMFVNASMVIDIHSFVLANVNSLSNPCKDYSEFSLNILFFTMKKFIDNSNAIVELLSAINIVFHMFCARICTYLSALSGDAFSSSTFHSKIKSIRIFRSQCRLAKMKNILVFLP